FLFGNAAFYVLASFVSFVLHVPPYSGAATTLALGLAVGQVGTYLLGRSFGINRVYCAVIGFLYATGPYLCVNLLVRSAFPEFLAWQFLPLICFLGRRAMPPRAGFPILVGLGVVMAFVLYAHKLVGPHIILYEFALLLATVRLSIGW